MCHPIAYVQRHAFDTRGDKKLFIDTASFRSRLQCVIKHGFVVRNSWSRTIGERTRGQNAAFSYRECQ